MSYNIIMNGSHYCLLLHQAERIFEDNCLGGGERWPHGCTSGPRNQAADVSNRTKCSLIVKTGLRRLAPGLHPVRIPTRYINNRRQEKDHYHKRHYCLHRILLTYPLSYVDDLPPKLCRSYTQAGAFDLPGRHDPIMCT